MDIIVAGGSDEQLIQSLDFKLPPSTNYILSRHQNKFYPSGASTFSPTGVRVARVLLSGQEGWIDPSTIKIAFQLNNLSDDTDLVLAGSPGVLVRRIRVLISGVCVEDTDYYGRVHSMFERLRPWNWNITDAGQSNLQKYSPTQNAANYQWGVDGQVLGPGYSAKVMFTPFLGILKSNKYLPIRYAPVTLEITWGDADSAVLKNSSLHPDVQVDAASTKQYSISQLEVFCSQIQLDSSLESSYANMLLQNRSLTFPFRTVLVQEALIPANATTAQISLVRALSRLDALFVTFQTVDSSISSGSDHPSVSFFNPSSFVEGGSTKSYGHLEHTLEYQVQIGSSLFPISPATSMGEHFYRLLETLDLLDQNLRAISITPQDFLHNSFILGTNLSRSPGQSFSSLSTRTGDLVTLKIKNMRAVHPGMKCYVAMLSTQVVEIRESGCSVYD